MATKNRMHLWVCALALAGWLPASTGRAQTRPAFPGPAPGTAQATVRGETLTLSNTVLECQWRTSDGHLQPYLVTDRLSGATVVLKQSECFRLTLADEQTLNASDLKIVQAPRVEKLIPDRTACRLAEQFGGKQIHAVLATPSGNLVVEWRAVLRDGSDYAQQYVTLGAKHSEIDAKEIVLVELPAPRAQSAGTVDGSPVAVGNLFFAFEHPLSKTQPMAGALRCSLPRKTALRPGKTETYSSAIGVAPEGQLRRGFLYYVEHERAQPYRAFLHYNSWYDIGYGAEKIRQADALAVVKLFGEELVERRGVVMDSFVLDDGWDDPASLWRFHKGFPDGFAPLQKLAAQYRSAVGAWLSPWGGYGSAKEERMKYGRQQGFETNANGFSLAGPKYYQRFRDVCVGMTRTYGLNYFKFDGIGSGGTPSGVPSQFASDVEALLQLIGALRDARADLFINVTTGTWPSPYWLWYGDSTWRAGRDWGTCGWGSKRQQQVTYRDNETFHNVVQRAPLYPLNSLMTQGIMFANHGLPTERDGLVADIRAFFASGTNCQELYITPSLLDAPAWDALAEAAKWSRDNADVLVDTHWIGGDPIQGEVYGWASWSARKATLSLRNPKGEPGTIAIDVADAFELPANAAQSYALKSPWKKDDSQLAVTLSAGKKHTFELRPFEVLVFDAMPR